MPLMARKRTATLLCSTEKDLTVLEFFAVGDPPTAVLLRAVKGGGSLPLTNISAIFKVHLSLFLWLYFFIGHLTLSPLRRVSKFSACQTGMASVSGMTASLPVPLSALLHPYRPDNAQNMRRIRYSPPAFRVTPFHPVSLISPYPLPGTPYRSPMLQEY